MPRTIKRYGSRKLYDSAESRYVSMQELAAMICEGQEIEVVDNKTGEDVTVPVLTQVISEQGRRGSTFPRGLLHDLIRAGEEALQASEEVVASHVKQIQQGVEHFVQRAARDTLGKLKPTPKSNPDPEPPEAPPSTMQSEMDLLRQRLDALEATLERKTPPADES